MRLSNYNTANPAFSSYIWNSHNHTANKMQISGVFFKTLFSLVLLGGSLWYVWDLVYKGVNVRWYTLGGMLAAIVFSILTSYKKRWAPITAPLYAIAKGFFLGGFSALINKRFEGYPMQAVWITILTFLTVLLLYQWRIIKVNKRFMNTIYTATFTIMMLYLVNWILSFFDIHIGLVWGTTWWAIGFNTIAAVIASLTLLIDFYYIDKHVGRAPKYMEWVATWGLLVSLIWLYVEVLRLMKKLAIRNS